MVSFSVTLQKRNSAELCDIVELAAETGAESVITVPLVAYKGLDVSDETVNISDTEIQRVIEKASKTAEKLGVIFSVQHSEESDNRENYCEYLHGWIFVDPEGKVFPCPYWNTSHPMGDFNENSFDEIWNGRAYNDLRTRLNSGIFRETCAVCPERDSTANTEVTKTDFQQNP